MSLDASCPRSFHSCTISGKLFEVEQCYHKLRAVGQGSSKARIHNLLFLLLFGQASPALLRRLSFRHLVSQHMYGVDVVCALCARGVLM